MRSDITRHLLLYCFLLVGFIFPSNLVAQKLRYPVPAPKGYICYQASEKITVDGKLSESEWAKAEWTDFFLDIIGPEGEPPLQQTRLKMLWDSNYFYFAVEMMEEHIWAKLTERDAVIYYDNDFEIFVDPDGDNHRYFELEINAFNTVWDLFLKRPYRDTTRVDNGFDMPNLLTAVKIYGTLNDPSDTDEKWTIEIAIPWKDIVEYMPGNRLPQNQQKWRINFSRVQWQTDTNNGIYEKKRQENGKLVPEYNWVWSPQWTINMHQPEFWGQVQFSTNQVGEKEVDFMEDMDFDLKMALMEIYQTQRVFFSENGHFTDKLDKLPLSKYTIEKFGDLIQIKVNGNSFKAQANGLKAIWKIDNKSHLTFQDYIH